MLSSVDARLVGRRISTMGDGERLVLVIDDDSRWANRCARFLRDHGFVPTLADRVSTARRALLRDVFEGVISEVRLRTDGFIYPALGEIARTYGAPVVCLTAYASVAGRLDAHARGTAAYFAKPASGAATYFAKPALNGRLLAALRGQPDPGAPDPLCSCPMTLAEIEWEIINTVLRAHNWCVTAAAMAFGMARTTLAARASSPAGRRRWAR